MLICAPFDLYVCGLVTHLDKMGHISSVALAAKLEAEDDDIDSEEERDIMKEIKYDIQNQVKEEMKEELSLYKYKKEKLEKEDVAEPGSDLEGLEPKLREAILKMRKLDKILAKKMKKERDVKRQRLLLQKKLVT